MTRTALLTGAGALVLGLLFLSQLSASSSAVPVQREAILVDLDPVAPDIWAGRNGHWTRHGFDASGWEDAHSSSSSGFGPQWIWTLGGRTRRVLFRKTFEAMAGDQASFVASADEARLYLNGLLVTTMRGQTSGDVSAFIVDGQNVIAIDAFDISEGVSSYRLALRIEGPFGRVDTGPAWKVFVPEAAPEDLGSGWVAVEAPSITRRSNPTVTVLRCTPPDRARCMSGGTSVPFPVPPYGSGNGTVE